MSLPGFRQLQLRLDDDTFYKLEAAHGWEEYDGKRQGRVLVDLGNGTVPIMRTTTVNKKHGEVFGELHKGLIRSIEDGMCETVRFNSAAAELYEPGYKKMRFHSDQGLDLAPGSCICIFSCYSNPDEPNPRRLVVRDKVTGATSSMPLSQNSVVAFDTATNARYVHKIAGSGCQSRWLGLTFRESKTFIDDKGCFVSNGEEMTLATKEEKKEFCRMKNLENLSVGFVYPEINYTLDLVKRF